MANEVTRSAEEERAFVLTCVGTWLECRKGGRKAHIHPTYADVSHSALLRRLLEGGDPLPVPPPRRFSYPDFALGEGQRVELMEVSAYRGRLRERLDIAEATVGDTVICDQSHWIVAARQGATWRLIWPDTSECYDLTTDGGSWYLQRAAPAAQEGE